MALGAEYKASDAWRITGGVAYDWFWRTFCREMSADDFYAAYLPDVLNGVAAVPVSARHVAPVDRYRA